MGVHDIPQAYTTFTITGHTHNGTDSQLAVAQYSIQFSSTIFNPADTVSYFIGDVPSLAPGEATGSRQIYIPRAGTIKAAYVKFINLGLGTTETSTVNIRLNNTTDTAIAATVNNANAIQTVSKTDLSIAVVQGDYIEIKWVAPTWATEPTNVLISGILYIE